MSHLSTPTAGKEEQKISLETARGEVVGLCNAVRDPPFATLMECLLSCTCSIGHGPKALPDLQSPLGGQR